MTDLTDVTGQFSTLSPMNKGALLEHVLDNVDPATVTAAVQSASPTVKAAARAGTAFSNVPAADRKSLYLTVIILLAGLAALALIGGAISVMTGKESTGFFTFAGLALGGLTGLFVPSPTSNS
jgi:hypothetical protein